MGVRLCHFCIINIKKKRYYGYINNYNIFLYLNRSIEIKIDDSKSYNYSFIAGIAGPNKSS